MRRPHNPPTLLTIAVGLLCLLFTACVRQTRQVDASKQSVAQTNASKQIVGQWQGTNADILVEFLPDGSYMLHRSAVELNVHLTQVPDRYKTLHLMTKKGQWEILDDRLLMTELEAYPSKTFWKNYAILQLTDQKLILKHAKYLPVEFDRAN